MSDFKGVWIPAKVWDISNDELLLIEKVFLCQIYSLCNDRGCYASNSFFADFFSISKSRCTQIIKKLEDQKYISVSLTRKGEMVVQRVVTTLNKCSELFKQGSNDIKQGSELAKQGGKQIKEGCLIHSDSTSIDKTNTITNKEENKEEGKKGTPPQNSEFEILQKEFLATKAELESLKAEKEKEKNSAKKEKGAHEFPKLKGTPAAVLTPPHKTDIEQAFYSAEDSANLKPYELAVQNYAFENWTETLKEAFFIFCEGKYETTKRKFSGTQAKELIKAIEFDTKAQGIERVEKCLRLCALNDWTYKISYQINQEARDKEDELKRQKQQANDPNISTAELAFRQRFGHDFGETEHQKGFGYGYIDQSEQEFS